jgi:hypothetical protein
MNNLGKIIGSMISIGVLATVTAILIPPQRAYGYGECSAPGNLQYAGVPNERIYKVQLIWDEYDFSLCDQNVVTKAYDIEIRNSADEIIREKTRTRNDKFSLPKAATKIKVKLLDYNEQLKFRVRAVANDGTTSNWSDYIAFTTPLQRPKIEVNKVAYDENNHTADVQLSWKQLDDTGFKFYRVKLTQYWYEAVSTTKYSLHTSTLLSKKITNNSTTAVTVQGLQEYLDQTDEQPYDEYYYIATVFGSYTIDGQTEKTQVAAKQFSVDSAGNLTTYFSHPSDNELVD